VLESVERSDGAFDSFMENTKNDATSILSLEVEEKFNTRIELTISTLLGTKTVCVDHYHDIELISKLSFLFFSFSYNYSTLCTSCSKTEIEEAIYEASSDCKHGRRRVFGYAVSEFQSMGPR
jgi:hypothetical protein